MIRSPGHLVPAPEQLAIVGAVLIHGQYFRVGHSSSVAAPKVGRSPPIISGERKMAQRVRWVRCSAGVKRDCRSGSCTRECVAAREAAYPHPASDWGQCAAPRRGRWQTVFSVTSSCPRNRWKCATIANSPRGVRPGPGEQGRAKGLTRWAGRTSRWRGAGGDFRSVVILARGLLRPTHVVGLDVVHPHFAYRATMES